jgi:hypothetical protein
MIFSVKKKTNDKFISLMFVVFSVFVVRWLSCYFNETCGMTFSFHLFFFILVQPHRLIIDRKESESLIIFPFSLSLSQRTDKKKNLSLLVKRSIATTNVYIGKSSFIFFARTECIMSFSFPQLT